MLPVDSRMLRGSERFGTEIGSMSKTGWLETLKGVQVALGIAALSCLASIMFSFMGGSNDAMDIGSLVVLQAAAIAVAVVAMAAGLGYAIRVHGKDAGLRLLWQHTPQWLVFVTAVLISLALFGEVAYIIVARVTGETASWRNHVPLLCLLASSVAICIAVAVRRIVEGRDPPASGRWP